MLTALESAIKLDVNCVEAYTELMKFYKSKGKAAEAHEYARKANYYRWVPQFCKVCI